MGFLNQLSSLMGKTSDYSDEYKKFKKAMERNPGDHGLKTQFINFCLLNRFTKEETNTDHIAEALRLFENINHSNAFDLQCQYLVGKYYQEEKDYRKAYQVYLNAIKHFNRNAGKNPDLKSDNVELAYSISLNLMTLQSNPTDPELEWCFKIIRKSFPLHVKRVEFENEMAKPAPDTARLKQLKEEILKLKAEEDKVSPPPAREKSGEVAAPKLDEKEDIFTKLFRVPTHLPNELPGLTTKSVQAQLTKPEKEEKKDHLQFSLSSEFSAQSSSFMVFRNNDWEGPFTVPQLRSMGHLDPATWICRVGSQLVTQAYEVPDLHSLIQ